MYGSALCRALVFALLVAVSCQATKPLLPDNAKRATVEARPLLLTSRVLPQTVFKHKHMGAAKLSNRPDILQKGRVRPSMTHRIVFMRKQSNMKELEEILTDVSDPHSRSYGQHLTKDKVAAMTANPSAVAYIKQFLHTHNIQDWNSSRYDDYISAEGPVHIWESLLDTHFFEFEHAGLPGKRFVRCLEYSLPEELAQYVDGVFNTVQFPDHHIGKRMEFQPLPMHTHRDVQATGMVDPTLLNQVYNIRNNTGNRRTSQAIYAILNQSFSPSDLTTFQNTFGLPRQAIADNVGGHVSDDACVLRGINGCVEANLDVQYIMAVAQNVPTTFYYWTGKDVWLDWIESVADLADPPDVFSISYGSYEAAFSASELLAFNNEAVKLGVVGTTLLAASGDDGVAGFLVRDGTLSCGYYASFPASSPYVTAVGGTMGPESGNAEVVCQSDGGSSITAGGGFSHTYPLPSWQAQAVSSYFARVAGTGKAPIGGYAVGTRGYPDVSALANRYKIAANGAMYTVSGTSASSPVVAGMVALVNSARRAAGNSTVGFLNPALYSLYPSFANDVTSGDNRCLSSGRSCCSQGFYATAGWDPASGLGSIDFEKFLRTMSTQRAGTPLTEPTIVAEDKAWLLSQGYVRGGCPSGEKVVAQTGYPAGQCLLVYDDESRPVSSLRYTCDTELGSAATWYYADLRCTAANFTRIDQQELGCVDLSAGSIVGSVSTICAVASGTTLPLPTGKHVVESAFNHPAGCTLNSTAWYNSYRAGHCFAFADSSSFALTDGLARYFNDTRCSEGNLTRSESLSEECRAATTEDQEEGDSVTVSRVTYSFVEVNDDSERRYLGMSSAAFAGVVAAVICAVVIIFSCLCYSVCRKPVHVAPAPGREAVVVHTIAQVVPLNYEEVPIAAVHVHHGGGTALV